MRHPSLSLNQGTASGMAVLRTLLTLAVTLCAVGAYAVLPVDTVEFVIITDTELAPSFELLATFKSEIGISSRVMTLGEIDDFVEPEVDLAATIRAFLQQAHQQWGTEYVLLGGTLDIIPTRWVYNTYYPTIGGTDLPVDLYYACLDGDWDADGDGIYGEPYGSDGDMGDDADMVPELGLGRAPVSTPSEAALFAQKSIAFHMQSGEIALPRALLSADVLFPEDYPAYDYVSLDGAEYAEDLRSLLEAVDPPWLVDRYYETCDWYPGTACVDGESVYQAMASGEYRLVHHIAFVRADSLLVGPDLISGDALSGLDNGNPFFLTSLGSEAAAPDRDSPLLRALLAENGGCAAALGTSRASFPITGAGYHGRFYEFALADQGVLVGDALRSTFASYFPYTYENRTDRWTCMSLLLLGDPTLPLSATEIPVSIDDREVVGNEGVADPLPGLVAHLTATPNPFNPRVEIRAELPLPGRVRVGVCDLRGREIQMLFDGERDSGEGAWSWNGKDRTGRDVASGVYFIRLETESQIIRHAVTLVR